MNIQGQTLRSALLNENNEDIRRELFFNFGKTLSRMHAISCPMEFKSEEMHWIDLMLMKAEYNLRHYETEGTIELLHELKNSKPSYFEQTLIHGDFTIDNILVDGTKVSGIIDWSGGNYGDPRYDVSLAIRPKPNAFQSTNDIDVFFEGYGKRIVGKEEFDFFGNEGLYAFF